MCAERPPGRTLRADADVSPRPPVRPVPPPASQGLGQSGDKPPLAPPDSEPPPRRSSAIGSVPASRHISPVPAAVDSPPPHAPDDHASETPADHPATMCHTYCTCSGTTHSMAPPSATPSLLKAPGLPSRGHFSCVSDFEFRSSIFGFRHHPLAILSRTVCMMPPLR
jgi:hypothetical protein